MECSANCKRWKIRCYFQARSHPIITADGLHQSPLPHLGLAHKESFLPICGSLRALRYRTSGETTVLSQVLSHNQTPLPLAELRRELRRELRTHTEHIKVTWQSTFSSNTTQIRAVKRFFIHPPKKMRCFFSTGYPSVKNPNNAKTAFKKTKHQTL